MELISAGGGAAAAGAATKEFWVPVTHGTRMFALGDFPTVFINGQNEYAHISFHVPHDFTAITDAYVAISPRHTGSPKNIDLFSDYGAVGELYAAHSESDTTSTYTFTHMIIQEIDISGILTALSAGDYVGIRLVAGDASTYFDVLGVRFKYS